MAGQANAYFDDPEKMQEAIDDYFENYQPVTITGLALHLGFESRQSFYDYEKREAFSYTIKRARLRIETYYEGKLVANNAAGPIFALKNMGWKDKTETEVTGQMGFTWNEQKTYEAQQETD